MLDNFSAVAIQSLPTGIRENVHAAILIFEEIFLKKDEAVRRMYMGEWKDGFITAMKQAKESAVRESCLYMLLNHFSEENLTDVVVWYLAHEEQLDPEVVKLIKGHTDLINNPQIQSFL